MEILRQPRLLVLLVVGPFVLLLLFGTGYSQNTVRLHTLFVGQEGSIYEQTLNSRVTSWTTSSTTRGS